MEAGDLYLDIDAGPMPRGPPSAPEGFGGVVEEVLRVYTDDPRRFFRIAQSALAATDFEIVDRELTRILQLSATDAELGRMLADVRSAANHADLVRTVVVFAGG
jgi:hypothetical protein